MGIFLQIDNPELTKVIFVFIFSINYREISLKYRVTAKTNETTLVSKYGKPESLR